MEKLADFLTVRNQTVERQILCSILVNRFIHPNIIPEYFDGKERELFDVLWIQWSRNKTIDPQLIGNTFPVEAGEILDLSPTMTDAAIHEVQKAWMCRSLARHILSIDIAEEPETIIRTLSENLFNILSVKREEKYIHSDAVHELLKEMDRIATLKDGELSGYRTGLTFFDKLTNGFEHSKMYVIGALKKTGKSRFAIYCAIKAAEQSAGVFINSLEMNRNQLNLCALAYYSNIDTLALARPMAKDNYIKTAQAWDKINRLQWCIYKCKTVAELRSQILIERQKRKIDVVIIDYIQRMRDPARGKDRVREVEAISNDLADMSRDLKIVLIVLAQLSGEAERLGDDEMPNMSHLKESQGIAESADTVIIQHNPDRKKIQYREDGAYVCPTILFRIDQRYGISGSQVSTTADLRICDFRDFQKD